MPELIFKGKEFVYNHHLAVPHHPLVPHPEKSIGAARMDGNLIIQGDNLLALKSLLPMYAGKVDCVFIDPPYNTGNEGWCYNDNVNSPMMQEWLKSNPVGIEDGLRHDKWCAMMWPRLRLLHELLADTGSLWITLDDIEVHRARGMLDGIFGEENFIANIAWHARESVQNDTDISTNNLNHLIGYAKFRRRTNRRLKASNAATWFDEPGFVFFPGDIDSDRFANPDNDPRGDWKADPFDAPGIRENLTYPITNPNTKEVYFPPEGRHWRTEQKNYEAWLHDNHIVFGKTGNSRPQLKVFSIEKSDYGEVETNWWDGPATTTDAVKELQRIFPDNMGDDRFPTPKPTDLLLKLLRHTTRKDSVVLDSFAGSGTTAHAVLAANKKDGGDRKFILVECEDYADTLTAERVRRVINGYAFTGAQREELLRKPLTFTDLKKADKLLDQIASIENLDGHRFDNIDKKVKDGELIVEGIKTIAERTEGLGGSFTYCTLGAAIEMDKMLTGETLPAFEQLGALLYHMATNESFNASKSWEKDGHGYLGESTNFHVWLIYQPDLDFLKSRDAALTLSKAKALVEAKPGKRHLVFAPAKFVSQKLLAEAGLQVEFAPLPFALYRIERS